MSFDYYGTGRAPDGPVTHGFAPAPGTGATAGQAPAAGWPAAAPTATPTPVPHPNTTRALPLPALLLGLGGVLLSLSSLLPWVSILVFDLSGLKVEWGAAALVGGFVAVVSAVEEGTGLIGRAARPVLRVGALLGGLAGAGAALAVRQRIGSTTDGFTSGLESAGSDAATDLGLDGAPFTGGGLEEGFGDFGAQLAEAFMPSAGVGLWLALGAGLVVAAGAVAALRD